MSYYGDRGARGITLFDSAWAGIVSRRPDFEAIDLFYRSICGRDLGVIDKNQVIKVKIVSLMKYLGWAPGYHINVMTEGGWKTFIDKINGDDLKTFVAYNPRALSHGNHSRRATATAIACRFCSA